MNTFPDLAKSFTLAFCYLTSFKILIKCCMMTTFIQIIVRSVMDAHFSFDEMDTF